MWIVIERSWVEMGFSGVGQYFHLGIHRSDFAAVTTGIACISCSELVTSEAEAPALCPSDWVRLEQLSPAPAHPQMAFAQGAEQSKEGR